MGHLCFGPSAGCPGGQGLLSGGGAVRASTEALDQRELWVGVRMASPAFPGVRLWCSFRGTQALPSVSLNWPPSVSMVFLAPSTSCGLGRGLSHGGPGDPWGPGEQVPAEMPWGSGMFPDALALGVRGRPWCFSHCSRELAPIAAHPPTAIREPSSGPSTAPGHPGLPQAGAPTVPLSASLHGQLLHLLLQGALLDHPDPLCCCQFSSSSSDGPLLVRLSPLLVFKLCGGRTRVCLPQLSAWHPGQAGFTGGA